MYLKGLSILDLYSKFHFPRRSLFLVFRGGGWPGEWGRAPFNSSAPTGGGGSHTTPTPPRPPPPNLLKDWAKFSSRPSPPIRLHQTFSSAPLQTQRHRRGGGEAGPPPPPLKGALGGGVRQVTPPPRRPLWIGTSLTPGCPVADGDHVCAIRPLWHRAAPPPPQVTASRSWE